jgi:hypothetical protein
MAGSRHDQPDDNDGLGAARLPRSTTRVWPTIRSTTIYDLIGRVRFRSTRRPPPGSPTRRLRLRHAPQGDDQHLPPAIVTSYQ